MTNELSCAIIRDLIPSYLDGICSEESGKAVDDHLLECKECRTHLESLKHTDLFMQKADCRELDYMRRVKRYYAWKNTLGAILLFAPALIILPIITKLRLNIEIELYYILFTVLALGSCLLLSNYQAKPRHHWPQILSLTSGVLGALYAVGLIAIVYRCLKMDTGFLGKDISEIGPILNSHLIAVVLLELLVFTVCAADSVRREHSFGILPTLNLTCCALCMCCRSILFSMDEVNTIMAAVFQYIRNYLLMTAGILLAECAFLKIRSYLETKIHKNL